MAATQKMNFLTLVSYSPLQTVQNVTDDRRQTDKQTTHCTKGSTDSTVGQKPTG